ncbi:MAG TPA: alpha/beta hydrolase family protein [Candidatus Binatia bacterium]|jgi:hypothetical protein
MDHGLPAARTITVGAPSRALRASTLARAGARLLPYAARARGGYFAAGIDRGLCRVLHDAARLRTLYRFGPPPPLRLGMQREAGDEYAFRSPFASPWRARNDACVRLHRARPDRRVLVVVNVVGGTLARWLLVRMLVAAFAAVGLDVAVPVPPGGGRRRTPDDRRLGWAHTVGAALAALVQLVHDNVALESWARSHGYGTIIVTGVGLGGTVAAVLAATTSRFDAYVPVVTGAHPGRLWMPPRPLARAVHAGVLARAGLRSRRALARLFDPVAPNRLPPPRARERCLLVGLRHEPMVPVPDVRDLATHWGVAPRWIARGGVELARWPRELAGIVAALASRHGRSVAVG